MHIAIVGTRGIPNRYGGFEQCAQEVAPRLVAAGQQVTVFNPASHEYRAETYRGVAIARIRLEERRLGPLGLFTSDWWALRQSGRLGADVVLVLGHTPAGLFFRPPARRPYALLTNIDGMERWRSKFGRLEKRLLLEGERRAVRHSDLLVADNPGIARYLSDTYGADSRCIEYGAAIPQSIAPLVEHFPDLAERGYFLAIARMEPENNLQMLIEGTAARPEVPLLLVGNAGTPHGRQLAQQSGRRVRFPGAIYDAARLNSLRRHALLYFHGHSVGGTNPALLEAMAAGARLAIHENPFNRAVVGADVPGFSSAADVAALAGAAEAIPDRWPAFRERIRSHYNWERISALYLDACHEGWQRWRDSLQR